MTVDNPRGMSSALGALVSFRVRGDAGLTYSASGLPDGPTISPDGVVSGSGRTRQTATVTVAGRSAAGTTASVSFVWTVT